MIDSQWINDFLLIAGPCSAESEQQLLDTAHALKNVEGVSVFRAGLWKPRTRPGSFAGVGNIGLEWLKKVKKETGLSVATEVACAEHVHQALEAGIDYLWIGARTTSNPFSVQNIAEALKGYQVPVLVKNPMSLDLFLWMGAIERIAEAGIERIAAVHRGFASVDAGPYRNSPYWRLPLELSGRMPGLPLICDPSHIAGSRDLISSVSQKAIDRGVKGLMVESHINPDQAFSDVKQQVTPAQLSDILASLSFKREFSEDESFAEVLSELRGKIDRIDHEILEALAARMEICRTIGQEKKSNSITPFQLQRLKELMDDRLAFASEKNLDSKLVGEIFNAIHAASVKIQSQK